MPSGIGQPCSLSECPLALADMSDSRPAGKSGDAPTVSRAFEDGTLVELLYDAAARTTALAVAHPDGTTSTEDRFRECLIAPSPDMAEPHS